MAYTQLQARVFQDGTDKTWGSGNNQLSVEISRTPTCETDRVYHARLEIEETGNTSPAFKFERQLNAGSWADVTGSSTVVKGIHSPSSENGYTTTNRLAGSALGFVAGEFTEDGTCSAISLNNQHTEIVLSFYIPSGDVADTDTVRIRAYITSSGDLDTYTETIEITVDDSHTLPGLISIAEANTHVETYGFVGPIFDSNGAMYVFSEGGEEFAAESAEDGFNIHAWKSADGGKRWLPSTHPTTSDLDDMESLSIARFSPVTTGEHWIFHSSGSTGDLSSIPWRASDHATNADTWDNTASNTQTNTAAVNQYWVAGVEKSDGDLWAWYGQTISTDERVYYRRQIAGSWQSQAALSVATSVNFSSGKASLGASDRVVVVYNDFTNNDIYTRAVADDNTLYPTSSETQVNTNSTTVFANECPIVDVLCYDTTNDDHMVIWLDSSQDLYSNTIEWNGSGYTVGSTPVKLNTTTVHEDWPNIFDIESVMASMAVDQATGTVYCFYFGTDFKLYYNSWTLAGGWAGESSALWTSPGTSERPAYVSSQVGTNTTGKVVGYVYKCVDSSAGEASSVDGNWYYDEISLLSGDPITLDPDGDGTISSVYNETGGTTNLYQSVDDDPDTAITTDWLAQGTPTAEADGSVFLTLTSTPANFASMESLSIKAHIVSASFDTSTCTLYAQVFASNETTAYTNEVTVATDASSGLQTVSFTINATGLAASKSDWDGARVKLRWDYTA